MKKIDQKLAGQRARALAAAKRPHPGGMKIGIGGDIALKAERVAGKRALLKTWQQNGDKCHDPVYVDSLKKRIYANLQRVKGNY